MNRIQAWAIVTYSLIIASVALLGVALSIHDVTQRARRIEERWDALKDKPAEEQIKELQDRVRALEEKR